MTDSSQVYGMIAEFGTPADTLRAATRIRAAGFQRWDVFTPYPIRGLDEAMGLRGSRIGWFTFLGAALGYVAGMVMIWYMNTYNYPLLVGGKPMFSPFSSFPPSFELAILFGALGTLLGMLWLNRLPRLYHPLFKYGRFALASRDRFFLVIETADPKYNEDETRRLLESLGSRPVELVSE